MKTLGMRISVPSFMDGIPYSYARTGSASRILRTAIQRNHTSSTFSIVYCIWMKNYERKLYCFSMSPVMVCPRWLRAVVACLLLFIYCDQSSSSPLTLSPESTISGNIGQPSSSGSSTAVLLYVPHVLLKWPYTNSLLDRAIIVPYYRALRETPFACSITKFMVPTLPLTLSCSSINLSNIIQWA